MIYETDDIINESAKSINIAEDIYTNMKDIKAEISKYTNDKFDKKSCLSVFTHIKRILSFIINLAGGGISGVAVEDIITRLVKSKAIRKNTGGAPITKTKLIRNAIQFVIGIMVMLLSKKVDESVANDISRSCESVISDLKKIKDKTEDKSLIYFIDDKIESLEKQLKEYKEAK